MQMTKDLYWIKRQIVVLNDVGSNPTGHPPKAPETIRFQGLFFWFASPTEKPIHVQPRISRREEIRQH